MLGSSFLIFHASEEGIVYLLPATSLSCYYNDEEASQRCDRSFNKSSMQVGTIHYNILHLYFTI